jgi:hypothetical protein
MPEKKRIEPGGYIANEIIDDISENNADVLRSLSAITETQPSMTEIYRLCAKMIDRVYKSDKAVKDLRNIYS